MFAAIRHANFGSDRSEEQARNSLRQCLSAIRKSLGDVADMVLLVDRTTVCLIPELIDIDVHEFEHLAGEGDYESLITAADLYQGEFLEGISIRDASCQEWLDSERGRFKRQFIEILSELAETQLLSHDFGNAIKSAERLDVRLLRQRRSQPRTTGFQTLPAGFARRTRRRA
jgi:DNA-binding SARP family transcriptional activator